MADTHETLILVRMRNELSAVSKQIAADTKSLNDEFGDLQQQVRQVGLAMTAAGAAMAAGFAFAAKAAVQEQVGIARLDAVLKNHGKSYAEVAKSLEPAIAEIQRFTDFGDDQSRMVVGTLIPILGDYEKAVQALPAVLDAAAYSGRDVTTVAMTLGRALSGQVNTAESVGVAFEETATFAERLNIVLGKVGGTAAAAANPFTQLKNEIGDLQEVIGAVVLNDIMPMVSGLTDLIKNLKETDSAMLAVVTRTGEVTAAILLLGGALIMANSYVVKLTITLQAMYAWLMSSALAAGILTAGVIGLALAFSGLIAYASILAAQNSEVTNSVSDTTTAIQQENQAALEGKSALDALRSSTVYAANEQDKLKKATDDATRALRAQSAAMQSGQAAAIMGLVQSGLPVEQAIAVTTTGKYAPVGPGEVPYSAGAPAGAGSGQRIVDGYVINNEIQLDGEVIAKNTARHLGDSYADERHLYGGQ